MLWPNFLCHAMAPFSCYGRIKANSAGKILMSPILIQKQVHQIVEHAYHQATHFFMSQNDHHLGDVINFDYVSPPPPPLLFKKLQMVVCVIVLSF